MPYALVVLAAAASLAGLAVRPATATASQTVDYVIVAGAAGLRWDDIDRQRTPTRPSGSPAHARRSRRS